MRRAKRSEMAGEVEEEEDDVGLEEVGEVGEVEDKGG